MIQAIDYWALATPLTMAVTAGLVLLVDVFLPRGRGAVTVTGILVALAITATQAVQGRDLQTFCAPAPSCSYVVDRFSLIFAALTLAAGLIVVLLSMAELASGRIPVGEWYFLLLATLTGAVLLPASRDLVMLVVSLELVSLPVFALTALRRYDGRSSEAALKLFVVSVVSTAIMLFGVSLLYGMTGTVHLQQLATALSSLPTADPPVVTVGIVLVVAGFAFKVAAVPFHSWAGDVYEGAPIPVAALLSVVSKAAGFAGLILVLATALGDRSPTWTPLIAVISALTMTVGNVLALRQRAAVRLLAWSSVAQSGYILAPLAILGVDASVAYLVFYAAMNLAAFAVVMLVGRRAGGAGLIDDYRGLAFRNPGAALSLAFALICLAGLPPGLAGLFAKVVVFREVVSGDLGWLAVIMAINTVIGLYYYLTWTARLFTPTSPQADGLASTGSRTETGGKAGVPVAVAIVLTVVVSVVFSIAPQLVLSALS